MKGQITNDREEDTGAGSGRQRQSRPLRAGAAVVLGLADRARCLALIGSSCLVPPAVSAAVLASSVTAGRVRGVHWSAARWYFNPSIPEARQFYDRGELAGASGKSERKNSCVFSP